MDDDKRAELKDAVGKKEGSAAQKSGGIIDISDKSDIIKIQQIRDDILSDNISKDLNATHQNRHIKDSKDYIEGRSIFDGTLSDAQELINTHHGTGEIRFSNAGNWIGKEFITLDRDIGTHIDDITKVETITNSFGIHYSKRGAHIVPSRRKPT